jgi:hypothetical protein
MIFLAPVGSRGGVFFYTELHAGRRQQFAADTAARLPIPIGKMSSRVTRSGAVEHRIPAPKLLDQVKPAHQFVFAVPEFSRTPLALGHALELRKQGQRRGVEQRPPPALDWCPISRHVGPSMATLAADQAKI